MRSPQRPRLSPYPSLSAVSRSPHLPRAAITVHSWQHWLQLDTRTERALFRQKIWLRPDILLCSVKPKTAFAFLIFLPPRPIMLYVIDIMWPYWYKVPSVAHSTPSACKCHVIDDSKLISNDCFISDWDVADLFYVIEKERVNSWFCVGGSSGGRRLEGKRGQVHWWWRLWRGAVGGW